MMNDIRHKILKSLLTFDRPLGELRQKLSKLEWDSENSLIRLSADHVRLVLARFLKGELSAAAVEEWANLIECREDIGFEPEFEAVLKDLIFELANPGLVHPIDRAFIEGWLDCLATSPSKRVAL
jgi:hypothetical protein